MSDLDSSTVVAPLSLGGVDGAAAVADPWDALTERGLAKVRARRSEAERCVAMAIENAWRARRHEPSRRGGHRASRVARVAARKATAKATADPDGEPPAEFLDRPIVTPAIDDVVEIAVILGPTEKAFHFAGVGAFFVSDVTGGAVVEAVAFAGPGVEARHKWLHDMAERMFGGRLEIRGRGLLS